MEIIKKDQVITLLRDLARTFEPFCEQRLAGTLRWDGQAYSPPPSPALPLDPAAVAWRSAATTAAAMLEAQDADMSTKQRAYLASILFGGMGSLQDFRLNETQYGDAAKAANNKIDAYSDSLFKLLARQNSN